MLISIFYAKYVTDSSGWNVESDGNLIYPLIRMSVIINIHGILR